jgi:hypothetical protein
MARRRLLEESPIPSTNEEPVLFDTSEIPWWAWVRRFHLPEVSGQGPRIVTGLHCVLCALLQDTPVCNGYWYEREPGCCVDYCQRGQPCQQVSP